MQTQKKTRLPLIGRVTDYKHLSLLAIWFLYFAMFILDEHIVTGSYWVSEMALDAKIPFCEYFVTYYVMWFPMLAATTIYTAFWDVEAFRKFMYYIAFSFISTSLIYLLWHNGQDLRPEVMPRSNFFTWVVQRLYNADTNTNVCPSLHVIGCFAICFAVFDFRYYRKRWLRICSVVLSVMVSVSTVFIKQHSVLDILVAIPYSLAMYVVVYKWIFRKKAE